MKARAHVLVSGLVQGVGYRFFTVRKAEEYGLTGWVRNLPNGKVEVVVEGDKELIEEFLKELRVGPPAARVTGMDVKWKEYKGEFQTFDVRFGWI